MSKVLFLMSGMFFFQNFISFYSTLRMILCLHDAKTIDQLDGNLSSISPYHSRVFPVFLEYYLCQNAFYETVGGHLKLT